MRIKFNSVLVIVAQILEVFFVESKLVLLFANLFLYLVDVFVCIPLCERPCVELSA